MIHKYFRYENCHHEIDSEGCWKTSGYQCCLMPSDSQIGISGCSRIFPCCMRNTSSKGCKEIYLCCGTVVQDCNNNNKKNDGCKDFCGLCGQEWGSPTVKCGKVEHIFRCRQNVRLECRLVRKDYLNKWKMFVISMHFI